MPEVIDKSKIIATPDGNVAKSTVLSIEDASTKIKVIIAEDYKNGVSVNETKSKVLKVISESARPYMNNPKRFNDIRVGLMNLYNNAYTSYVQNMMITNRGILSTLYAKKIVDRLGRFEFNKQTYQLKVDGLLSTNQVRPSDLLNNEQFRGFRTEIGIAKPFIKNYQQMVRMRYLELATINATIGTKPLRLKAELDVRYESSLKEEAKRKEDGVELVWISSHVNCSKRCERFQGKLYSLNNKSGIKDGHRYIPIEIAKAGINNDGNGCTSGYGCRHYTIPYQPNSNAPRDFDANAINKQRELDRKQRYYENQIRMKKQQEAVARANNDKTLANAVNKRWHKQLNSYEQLSLRNGRPIERWRTQVFRQNNALVQDDVNDDE